MKALFRTNMRAKCMRTVIWVISSLCIFETVSDTDIKQLKNSKETHYGVVDNFDYYI
jgi:hypothetical protein